MIYCFLWSEINIDFSRQQIHYSSYHRDFLLFRFRTTKMEFINRSMMAIALLCRDDYRVGSHGCAAAPGKERKIGNGERKTWKMTCSKLRLRWYDIGASPNCMWYSCLNLTELMTIVFRVLLLVKMQLLFFFFLSIYCFNFL